MKVGEFNADAVEIELDGSKVTAVWSDGVMLSADNGQSPFMAGMSAPCDFKLEAGKRYKVTVEEVISSTEDV